VKSEEAEADKKAEHGKYYGYIINVKRA
jgi:hypothetical protein